MRDKGAVDQLAGVLSFSVSKRWISKIAVLISILEKQFDGQAAWTWHMNDLKRSTKIHRK